MKRLRRAKKDEEKDEDIEWNKVETVKEEN